MPEHLQQGPATPERSLAELIARSQRVGDSVRLSVFHLAECGVRPVASGLHPRRHRTRPLAAAMLTTCPFSAVDLAAVQRELGRLEDHVAASGWAWDVVLSLRVDALHVQCEEGRA